MGIGVLSSKIAILFDIDETIDAFRRGTLDFDRSVGPTEERRRALRGPRILRQSTDGTLVCKIYVTQHNAKPFGHTSRRSSAPAANVLLDRL
jgi:hypothetical protein